MDYSYNPIKINVPNMSEMKPVVSEWHKHSNPEAHNDFEFGKREIFPNGDKCYQDFDYTKGYQSTLMTTVPPPAPIIPFNGGPSGGPSLSPQPFLGGY